MATLEDSRMPSLRDKQLAQAEAAEETLVDEAVKKVVKKLKGKK